MSEDGATPQHDEAPLQERLAAHERLSTGALARWTRVCATRPWRVVVEYDADGAAHVRAEPADGD